MKTYFILLVALASIYFIGCSKDIETNVAPPEKSELKIVEANYFLDGVSVSAESIDVEDNSFHTGITGDYIDDSKNEGFVTFHYFTTKEKYIEWGIEQDLPVALSFEMEEHLAQYADENGYIEEYEKTGEVSQDFIDYQNEYASRILNQDNMASLRAPTILHKDLNGGGAMWIQEFTPFLFLGWNNQTTRYMPFNPFTGFHIYDRSFYRRRLATLWRVGWQQVRFEGPLQWLDDRLSSCISIL